FLGVRNVRVHGEVMALLGGAERGGHVAGALAALAGLPGLAAAIAAVSFHLLSTHDTSHRSMRVRPYRSGVQAAVQRRRRVMRGRVRAGRVLPSGEAR